MTKYPVMSNYLIFTSAGEGQVLIRDAVLETEEVVPADVARFLKRLDGKTDPMKIYPKLGRKTTKELMDWFSENEMVTYGERFMGIGFLSFLVTLVRPRFRKGARAVAAVLNQILMISFLPVLIGGIWCWHRYAVWHVSTLEMFWLFEYLIALAIGMPLHELAHGCAALAYGGHVLEFGFMWKIVMPGAYVLTDDKHIRSPLKKAQIYAAGIEMNLLLGGLFLILGVAFPYYMFVCLMIAIINIVLGIVNASLIEGLDGCRILEQVLGIPDLVEKAKSIVFSRRRKNRLKKQGISGRMAIAACYIVTVFQLAYPIFLASMLLGWFAI